LRLVILFYYLSPSIGIAHLKINDLPAAGQQPFPENTLSGTKSLQRHAPRTGSRPARAGRLADLDIRKGSVGAILTKDADFNHLLNRFGHPPKVIWLRMGNTTTHRIIQTLVNKVNLINDFLADPDLGLLELY
jgi:predicted nuclease of predicted toxin-antitoxin system